MPWWGLGLCLPARHALLNDIFWHVLARVAFPAAKGTYKTRQVWWEMSWWRDAHSTEEWKIPCLEHHCYRHPSRIIPRQISWGCGCYCQYLSRQKTFQCIATWSSYRFTIHYKWKDLCNMWPLQFRKPVGLNRYDFNILSHRLAHISGDGRETTWLQRRLLYSPDLMEEVQMAWFSFHDYLALF